jgi:hypothetical protein
VAPSQVPEVPAPGRSYTRAVVPMRRLTSLQGTFRAHVLAARLLDEGFDVELRGALDGPYGLTVGDLARVDVYVPDDQIEDASMVLLVTEVDEVDDRFDDDRPPEGLRRHVPGRVVAALILFVLIAAPLAQVMRWY